jgi:hypothetical protein
MFLIYYGNVKMCGMIWNEFNEDGLFKSIH